LIWINEGQGDHGRHDFIAAQYGSLDGRWAMGDGRWAMGDEG